MRAKIDTRNDSTSRLLNNWLKLFSGSAIGSIAGLVATLLTARSLDVFDLGVLSIIQTFWRTLEGFLSFQSYQVFISFGAELIENRSKQGLDKLFTVCILADMTVSIAGSCIGVLLLAYGSSFFGLPEAYVGLAFIGVGTMLTMVTGGFQGALRLFNRFDCIAKRDAGVGALRLSLTLIAWRLHLPLAQYIGVWIASECAGNVYIIICGLLVYRASSVEFHGASKALPKVSAIAKSLLLVNTATMVRITTEEGDILFVSKFVGVESAGIYRVAKTLASAAYRFVTPLSQSIYPEIAAAVAKKAKFDYLEVFKKSTLFSGSIGIGALLIWVFLGRNLIEISVGHQYSAAYAAIITITAGYAIGFIGVAMVPSLYAFGRLKTYFGIAVMITISFYAVAFLLVAQLGILAAAAGQFSCYLVGSVLSAFVVRKCYSSAQWRTECRL